MLTRASLFAIFACLLVVYSPDLQAQKNRRNYPGGGQNRKPANQKFLETQWWLGFKWGANLTSAIPEQRFSAFSPTDGNTGEKTYEDFKHLGVQAGIDATFYHKGFSFSFQPNYRRQRFAYNNSFNWTDSNDPTSTLDLHYDQDHNLDYLELPLIVKYDFRQDAFTPFVQFGGYYGTLINATKKVDITGTDQASGASNAFEGEQLVIGADDLFIKTSLGILAGVGVNYSVGNLRLAFDVSYRWGLHNVTNAKNRFTENRLAGIGDALDDMNMQNLSFTFSTLFPLRFISKNFNSID